ncbi:MAG: hypothetical protein AAFN93_27810, partial [Bacteroidota bacterium]
MFNNYLKIAFRNFSKERFYASINVLGLALGIASSLLITLYVVHELTQAVSTRKSATNLIVRILSLLVVL